MLVSKREKYIAIGMVSAIALLVLNSFIIEPYTAALADISDKHDAAVQQLSDDANLFSRRVRLQKIWADMESHGLKTQESAADSQLQHAILDWAQQAGVNPQNLKSDQPLKEGTFQAIGYRVTATGTMVSISRLLWALETATMPIRVSDVRVTPEREGTDDLSVQLGVSTLCVPGSDIQAAPPAPNSATRPQANADDGGI